MRISTMQIASALPVIARIDCCDENFTLCHPTNAGPVVIYKGVQYSVTATGEPDVWQWRFQIGERSAAGKTRTRPARPGPGSSTWPRAEFICE
jgi:hypothetical protein